MGSAGGKSRCWIDIVVFLPWVDGPAAAAWGMSMNAPAKKHSAPG
jgi:hypothetical protein